MPAGTVRWRCAKQLAAAMRITTAPEAAHVVVVAEQIRETVESKKLVKKSTGDVLGSITISIGVAEFGADEAAESVIRRADACLYGAKQHGRNLVVNQNDDRMAALEVSAA